MQLQELERLLTSYALNEPLHRWPAYCTAHTLVSQKRLTEADDAVLAVSGIVVPFLILSCFSPLHSSKASIDTVALSRLLCYDPLNHSDEVIQFDWLPNANEVTLFDPLALRKRLVDTCHAHTLPTTSQSCPYSRR